MKWKNISQQKHNSSLYKACMMKLQTIAEDIKDDL